MATVKLKTGSTAEHSRGVNDAIAIVAKWPKWKRELTIFERGKVSHE